MGSIYSTAFLLKADNVFHVPVHTSFLVCSRLCRHVEGGVIPHVFIICYYNGLTLSPGEGFAVLSREIHTNNIDRCFQMYCVYTLGSNVQAVVRMLVLTKNC